jgi:hypothetical protein
MDETYGDRLKRELGEGAERGKTVAGLATHLGVSKQAVYAVMRGDTKKFDSVNNSRAAEYLGVHPDVLALGINPRGSRSHPMSQLEAIITPQLLTRGELVGALPEAFLLDVWDDSMADEIRLGSRLLFSSTEPPRPRDFVLIKDKDGNQYIREYRERTPTHWQAFALNAGYAPLDSATDGLVVLAVMIGRMGRRG